MQIHSQNLHTLHSRRKRNAYQVEIVIFDQIETPFGSLFWNRARAGWALLAALIGAVFGLACGSFLSSLVCGPLASSLIGLACSGLGAVVMAGYTLKESTLIPWMQRAGRRGMKETCYF